MTLGTGIPAIVLDRANDSFDGCYRHDGVIVLGSWSEEHVKEFDMGYFKEHRAVLERIGVPYDLVTEPAEDGEGEERYARCWFEAHTARDFLLMHVFLHELGHHHDHQTLRRTTKQGRGEDFAEAWAVERELELWPRYRAVFGSGRRSRL